MAIAAPAIEIKPLTSGYNESRKEESLFEKLIRERGGEMPRVGTFAVRIPSRCAARKHRSCHQDVWTPEHILRD